MTAKRFTVNQGYNDRYIYDNLHKTIIAQSKVCAIMNEQHETIQRLKQNIDELMQIDVEKDLLKENEQLKSQLIEKERMLDVRDKIIADVMKAVNGDLE